MRDEYNDEIENEEEESEQEKYQIDLEELEPINDEMFEEKVGQLSKDERTYNHLNIIIKHIFQRQIGSCFEYACVNLYHLLYLNIEELSTHNLSIELFRIQNNYSSFASCNHVVSVIGRRLNSNPSDYKTWGNAVIVDAHDVYVKDLMPQKLRLFFDIPNQKNAGIVSIPFNPNAHETVLVPDMNFSTKYVQNFTSDLLKIRALKKNSFFLTILQNRLMRNQRIIG